MSNVTPKVGDRILFIEIGGKLVLIPQGRQPEVGDTVPFFKLPDDALVTPGVSTPEVGDGAIFYTSNFQNDDGTKELILITGGGEIENCPYLGDATPRYNSFTITKRIYITNYDHLWISQTSAEQSYGPYFNVWGDLTVKVDNNIIIELTDCNGEEYSFWDNDFNVNPEGTDIELIFSGAYCGMLGTFTNQGSVFACTVMI